MGEGALDLVLIGGGLANGLIAWRLAARRPDIRFVVLEQGDRLGGNHTWSFHDGDLSPAQHDWMRDLVAHRWDGYDVSFPDLSRRLSTGYNSVTSERFHERLMARFGEHVRFHAPVVDLRPTEVRLASGEAIEAAAIIDGRGPRPSRHMALAFQKFLGQELLFDRAHGLSHPIIMDANVSQEAGYNFIYVLPFGPDRLLVEDTYYADGPALDEATLRARIANYAAAKGWSVAGIVREEQGVLPITLSGDIAAFWDAAEGVPLSGLAAGLFHPTTGYSLPDAARLADLIVGLPDLSAPALFAAIRSHAEHHWRSRRFYRLLNRMLFLAGPPERRYQVMQRFYRLPENLIRRFYAGETNAADKLRILSGKPPVPVLAAMRALAAGNLHRKAP